MEHLRKAASTGTYFHWSDCFILTRQYIYDISNLPFLTILLISFYHNHIVDIDFHWFFFMA